MIYFDENDVEGLGQAFLEALARRNSQRPAFRVGGNVGRRMCKAHPVVHISDMVDEPRFGTVITDGCGVSISRESSTCGGGGVSPYGGCGGGSGYGHCGGCYGHCGGMARRNC